MSASNEMMAKSIAILAKSKGDSNNKSMVEQINEKTALIPFKAKYPTQNREACDYLYQVYLHETHNKQLSAQTVYRSVMTTMPDHTRALFPDWLGMRALVDISDAKSKSTPSLANFKLFVLDQFNVSADRHTLDTWANTISFRDNEDPATWVQHARTLQRMANMYLECSQGETEATRILRFDDAWVLKLMVKNIGGALPLVHQKRALQVPAHRRRAQNPRGTVQSEREMALKANTGSSKESEKITGRAQLANGAPRSARTTAGCGTRPVIEASSAISGKAPGSVLRMARPRCNASSARATTAE